MNKDKYYNIKIMNRGYGKTYHEMQKFIINLQQENERLKDNQLKALDILIVVYGGNDEYYVKTIEKARNILQNGGDSE